MGRSIRNTTRGGHEYNGHASYKKTHTHLDTYTHTHTHTHTEKERGGKGVGEGVGGWGERRQLGLSLLAKLTVSVRAAWANQKTSRWRRGLFESWPTPPTPTPPTPPPPPNFPKLSAASVRTRKIRAQLRGRIKRRMHFSLKWVNRNLFKLTNDMH